MIDSGETFRFIITGFASTIANIAATAAAGFFMEFWAASIFGIAAGIIVSFYLSKTFAFRSKSWAKAPGEAARFLVVYGVGVTLYWITAVATQSFLVSHTMWPAFAGFCAIIAGGMVMMITGTFGHKLYTYR